MTKYMRERGFESYEELRRWSVEHLEEFWASIWDFFGVEGGYLRVGRSGVSGGHDAGRRLLMASFSPRISAALSSKWSLLAHAEALFPAREDRFVLDVDSNARELFEVSQFVWSLGIGASLTF